MKVAMKLKTLRKKKHLRKYKALDKRNIRNVALFINIDDAFRKKYNVRKWVPKSKKVKLNG